jgi:7-cyano-7-deazaguanine synthase in queuosine biosynthesis
MPQDIALKQLFYNWMTWRKHNVSFIWNFVVNKPITESKMLGVKAIISWLGVTTEDAVYIYYESRIHCTDCDSLFCPLLLIYSFLCFFLIF